MNNSAYRSTKYFFATLYRGTLAGLSAALISLVLITLIRLFNLTIASGGFPLWLGLDILGLIPAMALVGSIAGAIVGIPFATYLSIAPATPPQKVRHAIQITSIIVGAIAIWLFRFIFYWAAAFKGEPGAWWMSAVLLLVGGLAGYLGGYIGWRSWLQSTMVKTRPFNLFEKISLPD